MKILWITFRCIGRASAVFGKSRSESGGWVDALSDALTQYKVNKEIELHILALGEKDETRYDESSRTTYHITKLNHLRPEKDSNSCIQKWKDIISTMNPDIIQIWGTEFPFGRDVEMAANSIPVLFYIQGIIKVLAEHPAGDLSLKSLFFENSVFALPRFHELLKEIKRYKKQTVIENIMVKQSAGIIVDSDWATAQFPIPVERVYRHPLPINQVFLADRWSIANVEKYSIFTVAGKGGMIKGLHYLLLAVAKLKTQYPGIKVYVPGASSVRKPEILYNTICVRHINKIIRKHNLTENVVFTGSLCPDEMKEYIKKANVFVMPSCVENHSSSLREAMYCGCPSVTSDAGSTLEFVKHGHNGFIYRYNESDTLAKYIGMIFSNDLLAETIGNNARIDITAKYPQDNLGETLINIYRSVIRSHER